MAIRRNQVKELLRNGKVVYGTFVRCVDPMVVEVLGYLGFDFVVIDNEHSPTDTLTTASLIRAADSVDLVPIVRVAENSPSYILKALDSGALGVQVPQVNTPERARAAVASAKYTPIGNRGFAATHRAARHGLMDAQEYFRMANEETLVVAYVETKEAVDNLKHMVKVEGIDVFFIGPFDLSQSLGVPAQVNHPLVQETIEFVIRTVRGANRSVGTIASSGEAVKNLVDRGVQYIIYSSDLGMLAQAGKEAMKEFVR